MISGIGASLAGLQQASKRIETAANNIASSGRTVDSEGTPVTRDPTQDIVDLTVAAHDFKANAKAIEVQNSTQQYLLDILA